MDRADVLPLDLPEHRAPAVVSRIPRDQAVGRHPAGRIQRPDFAATQRSAPEVNRTDRPLEEARKIFCSDSERRAPGRGRDDTAVVVLVAELAVLVDRGMLDGGV